MHQPPGRRPDYACRHASRRAPRPARAVRDDPPAARPLARARRRGWTPTPAEQAQLLRDGLGPARARCSAELTDVTARAGSSAGRWRRASAHSSRASTAARSTRRSRSTRRCASRCSTSCTSSRCWSSSRARPRRTATRSSQAFLERWAAQMRAQEDAIRAAVIALADDPDLAVRAVGARRAPAGSATAPRARSARSASGSIAAPRAERGYRQSA